MCKQLYLFPELTTGVVSNLDELALQYTNQIPVPEEVGVCNVEAFKRDMQTAFKDGAKTILADIIDLLKKYTDLHES
jgi:hypothetical protein